MQGMRGKDPEPIWHARDTSVKQFCEERGIQWVEKVSHTLWDPHQVVKTNGGTPPLTYQMFLKPSQVQKRLVRAKTNKLGTGSGQSASAPVASVMEGYHQKKLTGGPISSNPATRE
uniref:Photolyase/cryptochrome alpha/beta domain-containing protein n=1 Tax=Timema cristinae TaxID=61476 RepID=A0A7R9DGV3_TIMCR|nr:unnamed protein product [Timema cristinae]